MASSNIGGENRDLVLNPDHGSQPPYFGRPAAIRAALGCKYRLTTTRARSWLLAYYVVSEIFL